MRRHIERVCCAVFFIAIFVSIPITIHLSSRLQILLGASLVNFVKTISILSILLIIIATYFFTVFDINKSNHYKKKLEIKFHQAIRDSIQNGVTTVQSSKCLAMFIFDHLNKSRAFPLKYQSHKHKLTLQITNSSLDFLVTNIHREVIASHTMDCLNLNENLHGRLHLLVIALLKNGFILDYLLED